ncbi:MAG: serine/threonine protein kinase [Acetatifactor sp.]|nr:serine/threonine protein kinase [Acetatifactor sp.]
MELIAGCFRQECQGDFAGVCRAVRKRDRVPIVLLYAVDGSARQGRTAKTMEEWFHEQALRICGRGKAAQRVDEAAESFRRWMAGQCCGYAAVFCMGGECFYVWRGGMAVCQINRHFDKYHLRKLSVSSQRMVCVRTAMEAGVGVLLCHEAFLEGFTAEQIRECLAVGELSGLAQVEKRLRELAEEAGRRGIGHRATAFVVTKEAGLRGCDEILEEILRRHGYTKVKILGRGAFGHVYQVQHLKSCKKAACKVAISAREQKVLRREAMLQRKIDHPLFARFLDWIEEDDFSILLMEYVRGRDLSDILRHQSLSMKQAVRIAIQLANGLQYLHELPEPVLYRDLKPENIRIGAGGKVKLLDLGCACPLPEAERSLAGSRGYAAPEQLGETAGTCGYYSDIYALGRVLMAMLARDGAVRWGQYLDRVLPGGGVPAGLGALIERCVEINPAKRPKEMAEVARELEQLKSVPTLEGSPRGSCHIMEETVHK